MNQWVLENYTWQSTAWSLFPAHPRIETSEHNRYRAFNRPHQFISLLNPQCVLLRPVFFSIFSLSERSHREVHQFLSIYLKSASKPSLLILMWQAYYDLRGTFSNMKHEQLRIGETLSVVGTANELICVVQSRGVWDTTQSWHSSRFERQTFYRWRDTCTHAHTNTFSLLKGDLNMLKSN